MKRLYLVVGLLMILVLGLLWHAGSFLKGTRATRKDARQTETKVPALKTVPVITIQKIAASTASEYHTTNSIRPVLTQPQPVVVTKKIAAQTSGENQLADNVQTSVVRKKLPPMPPVPASPAEPSTATAAPAAESMKAAQETLDANAPPAPSPPPVSPPASMPAPAVAVAPVAPASQPQSTPPAVTPVVPAKEAPSAQVEPKAPSIKPSAVKGGAYPYSLLLSSCRERENAVAVIHYSRRDGLNPFIVQADLGGRGKWWRTLNGSYKTQEAALQAKKSLKLTDAIVVKTPFANLVGEFPSEKEAAEQSLRLSQKGLFPYLVQEPGQPVQLLVGAFPDRQAAEEYQRELDAKGIVTQVLLR